MLKKENKMNLNKQKMMNSTSLTQESGRSMVEMLGTLAIMGIISAGGLYGYNTAMNRHRANELINEANKRAVIVAMQLASGKTAPETADKTLIGEFTDPVDHEFKVGKANDKQFNIEITKVSEDVCDQLKTARGGVIKGFSPDTCESGNANTVKLTFNNDMSTQDSENSSGSGEDGTEPLECVMGYESNQAGTACSPCSAGTECSTCDPDTPIWDGQNCVTANVCSSYSGTAPSNTTVNGVTYSGGIAGVGTDVRTICRCPANYGVVDNACTLCSGNGDFVGGECVCDTGWYNNICDSTCDGIVSEALSDRCFLYDQSETCMHSVKVSSYNADGTFSYAATCDSCDYTEGLVIPAQECDRCSDEREMRYIGGKNRCVLKNCPTGRYRAIDGACNSCTGTSSYQVEDVSDCDVCEGGRTTLKINNDLYCYLKNCGTNKFHTKIGDCQSCSVAISVETSEAFCSECDGTPYPRHMSGNKCVKN